MRVEPFDVGSYVHVIKRGARGADIVREKSDYWRFLRLLFFMNDAYTDNNWMVVTKGKNLFERPARWPVHEPLVVIECFTLMPNHFHLLLREIQEGGVSKFMKKLSQSMSEHANLKYNERGSLFQGSYRSRTIDSDTYLRYVAAYIMVKNTLELYPKKGLIGAQKNFEDAWKWAITYPFSSLGEYAGSRTYPSTLSAGILKDIFKVPQEFRSFSRDVILGGKWDSVAFE